MTEKNSKLIYLLVAVGLMTSLTYGALQSGFFPSERLRSVDDVYQYVISLKSANWLWTLGIPGTFGLIFLNRKREYVIFLGKMFKLILAVMAVPVFIGIWGAVPKTINVTEFMIIYIAVLVLLSGLGAIMMAQKEYVFGDYKKDTAWRQKDKK